MGVWGKSQNGKKNSFWNRNTYPHCRIHSSTLEVYSRQITVKHGSISLNITLDRKKYTNAIQKRCWKRLHSGICIRGEVILSLKQNFITGQETLRGRYDRTQRTGRWGSRTSRSDKKKKVGWEWKGKQGMSIPTEWWNQRHRGAGMHPSLHPSSSSYSYQRWKSPLLWIVSGVWRFSQWLFLLSSPLMRCVVFPFCLELYPRKPKTNLCLVLPPSFKASHSHL